MNVAKHWHVAGEVFAISDCLVVNVIITLFLLHIFMFAYVINVFVGVCVRECVTAVAVILEGEANILLYGFIMSQ